MLELPTSTKMKMTRMSCSLSMIAKMILMTTLTSPVRLTLTMRMPTNSGLSKESYKKIVRVKSIKLIV